MNRILIISLLFLLVLGACKKIEEQKVGQAHFWLENLSDYDIEIKYQTSLNFLGEQKNGGIVPAGEKLIFATISVVDLKPTPENYFGKLEFYATLHDSIGKKAVYQIEESANTNWESKPQDDKEYGLVYFNYQLNNDSLSVKDSLILP